MSLNLTGKVLAVGLILTTAGAQAVNIELVPVGDPGNAPDTRYSATGFGAVPYTYQIGKFEVTAGQYAAFLNAVAAADTYGLYSTSMGDPSGSLGCNIERNGTAGNYSYSVAPDWANRPVNYVSWGDAVRFANWLSNGQPNGGQDISTTEDGSYFINGKTSFEDLMTVMRKPIATWVIPTEDEWYKAAYYKGGGPNRGYWSYPIRNVGPPVNTLLDPDPGNHANFFDPSSQNQYTIAGPYWRTPVGAFANSYSPYGTFDQGGNVFEWNETNAPTGRGVRGGAFDHFADDLAASPRSGSTPTNERSFYGFRMAFVPEPGSMALLLVAVLCLLGYAWQRKQRNIGVAAREAAVRGRPATG